MGGAEQQGSFLEDLAPGTTFNHPGGRTLTETDVLWFSLLSMNQHPLHVDFHSGPAGEATVPIAPAPLVLSVVIGLSVRDVSWNATRNLEWTDTVFGEPVRAGDTLRASSEVLSRDDTEGVVACRTIGVNQNEEEVVRVTRSVAIARRG